MPAADKPARPGQDFGADLPPLPELKPPIAFRPFTDYAWPAVPPGRHGPDGPRRAHGAPRKSHAEPQSPLGQRVLVIGADGVVGGEVARRLAAGGHRVGVHHSAGPGEAATLAVSLPGDGHFALGADLGDAGEVDRMVDRLDHAWGGVDTVVIAAGAVGSAGLDDTSDVWSDAFGAALTVDVLGAALVIKAATRVFRRNHLTGRIVLVMAHGQDQGQDQANPIGAATTAAVGALADSLAPALAAQGIGISTVSAGRNGGRRSPELIAEAVAWMVRGAVAAPGAAVSVQV